MINKHDLIPGIIVCAALFIFTGNPWLLGLIAFYVLLTVFLYRKASKRKEIRR